MALRMDRIVPGGTADIVLDVVDTDGNLLTTSTGVATVTITNPSGTSVVSGASMTLESAGRYLYRYASSTADPWGFYRATATWVADGVTEKVVLKFEVRGDL